MIQRLQTLYLLASVIALSLMLLFPLAEFISKDSVVYSFDAIKIASVGKQPFVDISSTVAVFVMIVGIALSTFFSIFMYKNRIFQIKLCWFNVVLTFLLISAIAYYIFTTQSGLSAQVSYSFTLLLPLASILLTFLASRSIRKDENLVRSADRIR